MKLHTLIVTSAVLMLVTLTGCSSSSLITLKDGRQIHAKNTPKLNSRSGFYSFKEMGGTDTVLNKDEVLSIKKI